MNNFHKRLKILYFSVPFTLQLLCFFHTVFLLIKSSTPPSPSSIPVGYLGFHFLKKREAFRR